MVVSTLNLASIVGVFYVMCRLQTLSTWIRLFWHPITVKKKKNSMNCIQWKQREGHKLNQCFTILPFYNFIILSSRSFDLTSHLTWHGRYHSSWTVVDYDSLRDVVMHVSPNIYSPGPDINYCGRSHFKYCVICIIE